MKMKLCITTQDIGDAVVMGQTLVVDEVIRIAKDIVAAGGTVEISQIKGGAPIKTISTVDEVEAWGKQLKETYKTPQQRELDKAMQSVDMTKTGNEAQGIEDLPKE